MQSRVYEGSSLAEAEADVRARYALPKDVDLYTDYQGDSVDPETVQAFIEVAEEIVTDAGLEAVEQTEPAEATASSRRAGVRRVVEQAVVSSLENGSEAADSTAYSGSVTADSVSVAAAADSGDVGEVQTQNTEGQSLFAFTEEAASFEIATENLVAQAASCTPTIEHTGNGNLPDYVKAGSGVRFSWYVKNSSAFDISGYRLKMHSISPNNPATFSETLISPLIWLRTKPTNVLKRISRKRR